MGREQELIEGHDARDPVAAIDQDAKIARERPGIAGDRDEPRDFGLGKHRGLRRGACPRRIENDCIVGF